MGEALSVLAPGRAWLFDEVSTVEVRLFNADAVLATASDAALLNGANACLIGEELIQFGAAEPAGPGRWRLGRLLRGRRGTEPGTDGHAIGDGFVRIDAEALLTLTADR